MNPKIEVLTVLQKVAAALRVATHPQIAIEASREEQRLAAELEALGDSHEFRDEPPYMKTLATAIEDQEKKEQSGGESVMELPEGCTGGESALETFQEEFLVNIISAIEWMLDRAEGSGPVSNSAARALADISKVLHVRDSKLKNVKAFSERLNALKKCRSDFRDSPMGRIVVEELDKAIAERERFLLDCKIGMKLALPEEQKKKEQASNEIYAQLKPSGPDTWEEWFKLVLWPRIKTRGDFLKSPKVQTSKVSEKQAKAGKKLPRHDKYQAVAKNVAKGLAKRPIGWLTGLCCPPAL
jgi:hypothetical protein